MLIGLRRPLALSGRALDRRRSEWSFWITAALVGLAAFTGRQSYAQPPAVRPPGVAPPAYSPYLDLLRNSNPAYIDYYGLVRPEVDIRNQVTACNRGVSKCRGGLLLRSDDRPPTDGPAPVSEHIAVLPQPGRPGTPGAATRSMGQGTPGAAARRTPRQRRLRRSQDIENRSRRAGSPRPFLACGSTKSPMFGAQRLAS